MLNEKAKAIYEFIKDSINSGFPPTVREICNALDIKSTSTVHKYITYWFQKVIWKKWTTTTVQLS